MKGLTVSICARHHGIGLLLLWLSTAVPTVSAEALSQPVPAPSFELAGLDGNPVSLKQYQGKVVIVNFWGTFCKPCLKETPDLVAVQQQFADKGLTIIGAAMDQNNLDGVKIFAKKYFVNYPMIETTAKLNRDYGVIVAPTTIIINKAGNIVYRHAGALNRTELADLIKPLL